MTFDFAIRPRIVFGPGSADRTGALVRECGGSEVLLVTDPHIERAGHVARVRRSLDEAGVACRVFDDVHENPTTRDVRACLEFARQGEVDLFVALGGGSCIDAAKGCNFLLTNGGEMADYRGRETASKPMLPLIAIPTTAGTGSEMQSFALIADEHTHQKMACGDPKAAARIAILDPSLAASQPRFVSACTGLDAITHAVESAVTARRNPISDLFAREAFRLAASSFARVLESPDDLDAQGRMMLAAAFAGVAIENSMLGAAHSMANPLTARFDVVHGQAVGTCLPHVVAFNRHDPAAAETYRVLAAAAGMSNGSDDPVDGLIAGLRGMLECTGLPPTLSALGVPPDAADDLAAEAATQWTARFNPRPLTEREFAELYRAAID